MGPCTSSMKLIMVLQQIRNLPSAVASVARPFAFGPAASFAVASGFAFKHFASCSSPSSVVDPGAGTPRITAVAARPASTASARPTRRLLRSCPFIKKN